jgi:hypothetical protein
MRLQLTPEAGEVLRKVAAKHGELYLIIGDTGCCGYSNVFLTVRRPLGDYSEWGELVGVEVFLRPPLDKTLSGQDVLLDVVESPVDDSLSLETELGYRFILRVRGRV